MLSAGDVNKPMLTIAGFCGATGVALAAAASHAGGADLGIAASFLQLHAPALIGISFLKHNRLSTIAGCVLVVALVLFAGDLVVRAEFARSLFPLAAPIGGTGMIIGWLLLAVSGFFGWRGQGSGAAPE